MSFEWLVGEQTISVPVWVIITYGALWTAMVSRFVSGIKKAKKS